MSIKKIVGILLYAVPVVFAAAKSIYDFIYNRDDTDYF